MKMAQMLIEKAVRECVETGFTVEEVALIGRVTPERVRDILDNPRQYKE